MTEQSPEEVRFLYGMFEGTLPDGTLAGYAVHAGPATPPEALEMATRMGIQGLTMQYPGVRDVKQVGEWTETAMELPADDDETTEEA
jgi:hypothetical protein